MVISRERQYMPTRKYSLTVQGLAGTDDRMVILSSVCFLWGSHWVGHDAMSALSPLAGAKQTSRGRVVRSRVNPGGLKHRSRVRYHPGDVLKIVWHEPDKEDVVGAV